MFWGQASFLCICGQAHGIATITENAPNAYLTGMAALQMR